MADTHKTLAAKLAEVYLEVQRVPKTGKHPQGWTFASEGDVADMIRRALGERGIILRAEIEQHETEALGETRNGAKITRHTVKMNFTLTDGESLILSPWYGQADDMSDKGLPKAITAARKTFLLSTFLISTGDEPDAHDVQPERPVATPAEAKRKGRWAALQETGRPLTDQDIMATLKSIGVYQSSALESDEKYEEALQVVAAARDALEAKPAGNPGPIGDQKMGRSDG